MRREGSSTRGPGWPARARAAAVRWILLATLSVATSLDVAHAEDPAWQPVGPYGATVFALTRDPADPDILYAGTFFGGLYRSSDGGVQWSHLASDFSDASVFGVAVDPTQTTGTTGDATTDVDGNGGSDGTSTSGDATGTSSSDTGGTSGSDGNTGFDFDACASVEIEFTPVIPTVILLVDRSGSMVEDFGGVTRFEADNLMALNFLLEDSLGGGGSASIKTDAQGKTHGLALLRMRLDVPEAVLAATPEPTRAPD